MFNSPSSALKLFIVFAALALGIGVFFFFFPKTVSVKLDPQTKLPVVTVTNKDGGTDNQVLASSSSVKTTASTDIEKQSPLIEPPAVIRGIYLTNWTASSPARVDSLVALAKKMGLNAMVIDMKDYSGYVGWRTGIETVVKSGAENQIRIANPNSLIKKLHDNGIYAIARVSVFQDPVLAKAHPEWTVGNKVTGKPWTDRKGLAWMNPNSQEVWDYDISLAKDAVSRGFDEVNFDYIRFPSDGDLTVAVYPGMATSTAKHTVIGKFFKYVREQMPTAKLSADLFGLSTINKDDLGVGQVIEDGYKYFDYICPMVYPSHYATGFMGFKNPAAYPYEVVKRSMDSALAKLNALKFKLASSSISSTIPAVQINSKLRPWLQAFDLGATYTRAMIDKEIQATNDSLASSTASYNGWLLWDPSNVYKNYR